LKELAVNMNIYILVLKLTLNLGSKVQNFGHNIQQEGGGVGGLVQEKRGRHYPKPIQSFPYIYPLYITTRYY